MSDFFDWNAERVEDLVREREEARARVDRLCEAIAEVQRTLVSQVDPEFSDALLALFRAANEEQP